MCEVAFWQMVKKYLSITMGWGTYWSVKGKQQKKETVKTDSGILGDAVYHSNPVPDLWISVDCAMKHREKAC